MYACILLTQTQMYTHSIRQQQSTLGQDDMKAFTNAAGCEAQPQSRILKTWEGNKGWWNAFIFLKLVNKEDKDSHLQKSPSLNLYAV